MTSTESEPTEGRPCVGVLAVQGDFREHMAFTATAGARAVAVRRPSDLEGIDGLIIPGGESTTIDKLSRIFELDEPIRQLIADGLPVYGSCAGLIMLADRIDDPSLDAQGQPQRTFGGIDMTVKRNAFGRQRESFEVNLEFSGLEADPVHAVFIRAPLVLDVGPGVEILARVGDDDVPVPTEPTGAVEALPQRAGRIVAVRSGNLLATSFHPEVTNERRVHELFMKMIARR
jgi:5'-phosphate synthase pdxT subunit